jgi:uncharacterized protein (TIGR02594 family)
MNNCIKNALCQYGISSIPGPQDNPEILKYFHEIGATWVNDDETPWCAAFANWVLKKSNLPFTNKLNARSFLDIGIPTTEPELGDLVILWRISPTGPYGHVGFFIFKRGGVLYILGGNQDDCVRIKGYSETQLLGYRKLVII